MEEITNLQRRNKFIRILRKRIKKINRNWNKSIILSDFKNVKEKLRIGSLFGNRFTLAIRFIDCSIEKLKQSKRNKLIFSDFILFSYRC